MNYSDISPIDNRIPAMRQGAKRHYGVHPYFTRRPYNVVRDYILNYSKEGDSVIDPFGGSGVTAIEAFLENRIGIQSDINPFANFIATSIAELPISTNSQIESARERIRIQCVPKLNQISNDTDNSEIPRDTTLPPNCALPKTADVDHYHELFSRRQLISLSILKSEIDRIEQPSLKKLFLLAWSGTLARVNRTFISTNGRAESRGGSSIFSIYRYKVARRPVELDTWEVYNTRLAAVLSAREEIRKAIEIKEMSSSGWKGKFKTYKLDVIDLSKEFKNQADYIFTDPPYGGHIAYLDLSMLWNVWLGDLPDNATRSKELIVGGEKALSEDHYFNRLFESVKALFTMLKDNRWLSIVFQHWNVSYFKAILDAAEDSNGILKAAVSQVGDPIWSMHKKKGKSSVLAGELILTFFKDTKRGVPQIKFPHKRLSFEALLKKMLDEQKGMPVFGESLFNGLVIKAWENGVIDDLYISKLEFSELMQKQGWSYESKSHTWQHLKQVEQIALWA